MNTSRVLSAPHGPNNRRLGNQYAAEEFAAIVNARLHMARNKHAVCDLQEDG